MAFVTRGANIGLAATTLLIAAACGAACATEGPAASDTSDTRPALAAGGEDGGAVHDGVPMRAEFGLDVRPPNETCLAPARPPAGGALKLDRVYANVNLQYVMAMAQAPGDGTRWFVGDRMGKIVSFAATNPGNEPTVVADLAAVAGKPVATDLSGGFLGFAFHPSFQTNGRLYVTFTTTSASGPASELGYLESRDSGASFTSYTKVFAFARPSLEWNGGGMAFGKDGELYASFGADPGDGKAQSPNDYGGKIIRLDVDHPADGRPYGIPSNNPFESGGGYPEIFALGFRNPFRLSVDRETGDLWVGDVGQDKWEEIDRVEVGKNYGWPCREGAHDYDPNNPDVCPSAANLADPIFEYEHVAPNSGSVTGGVVYRGAAMPAFQGTYIYGDFIRLQAAALTFDAAATQWKSTIIDEGGSDIAFSLFTEDNDGEVYATTVLENKIYKLVPATSSVPSTFPDRLSRTGCFDPSDPKKPAAGLIPYGVNSPLFSDGAEKERMLALPEGKTISVGDDGDFDLPIGSVLSKTFSLDGKRVETRLFVRHDDGDWAGYAYEWNDAQTDAVLLPSSKTKTIGARTWTFPSRSECFRCHGAAAGRTLGLELAQLNRDQVYPSTARVSNQLATFEHIGLLSKPLGRAPAQLAAYPPPFGDSPLEARARAYLHANCSMCHRPNGNSGRAGMDFRFSTAFADTKSCNVVPVVDDLGVRGSKIIDPGKPESSIVSLRTHATSAKRMPPLGTRVVDAAGVQLLDTWIRSVKCP